MATNEDYKGNKELKKHGIEHEYTKEEIEEYIKCSKDIVHFAKNYIKVVHPDKGLIPIDLYPFQNDMLEHFDKNRFSVCLAARQVGKTCCFFTTINVRRTHQIKSLQISIGYFFNIVNGSNEHVYKHNESYLNLETKKSNKIIRRYKEIIPLNNEWEVETPSGWSPLSHVMKTIPYKVWTLTLSNGLFIEGADNHIIINSEGEEVFLKDCKKGDLITTRDGSVTVLSVFEEENREEEMFDLDINDSSHVFWTNDILSHNCVLSDTLVTVLEDDEEGSSKEITIKELFELLCSQRSEEE